MRPLHTFLEALADVAQRSPRKPFAREMQAFVEAASREVYAPLLAGATTAERYDACIAR